MQHQIEKIASFSGGKSKVNSKLPFRTAQTKNEKKTYKQISSSHEKKKLIISTKVRWILKIYWNRISDIVY